MARDDVLLKAWRSAEFARLSRGAQALFSQLATDGNPNSAGVLALMPEKWASRCLEVTPRSVMVDLDLLADRGFMVVDSDSFEVLIRNYIRDSGSQRNPNHFRGAINAASAVESAVLRQCLLLELHALGAPLTEEALAAPERRPSRRHIPVSVRRAVYERDGWRCVYCSRAFEAVVKGAPEDRESSIWLELDHVKPYSLGGDDTVENLRAACSTCNRSRGVDDTDLWAEKIGDPNGA